MVDLSEFQQHQAVKGPRCSARDAINALNESDREKLIAALADRTITSAAIGRWCATRDVKIAGNTLARHRRGECSCD